MGRKSGSVRRPDPTVPSVPARARAGIGIGDLSRRSAVARGAAQFPHLPRGEREKHPTSNIAVTHDPPTLATIVACELQRLRMSKFRLAWRACGFYLSGPF